MPDDTSLISACFALGGTIVGAFSAFYSQLWIECRKEKKESRITAEAIVTEIKVFLLLFEKRHYLDSIKNILDCLKSGETKNSRFKVIVPDDFCIIYKRNIEKIGLLPDSIRNDIVSFYQLLEAVICDVRPGGLVAENECGAVEFQQLYDIVTEIQRIGNRIVSNYSLKTGTD